MIDNLPTPEEIEICERIDKWFNDHNWYIKVDEVYGINVIADIAHLVKDCIAISKKHDLP